MSKMTTEKTKSPRFVRFDISGDDEGDEKEPEFEIEDDGTIAALSTPTLLAVTCSAGGLQIIWSTLFSNGSAYLFSLGITKSQSSLVWAAAPISGTFIQPLVGALSDNSRSRFGRRRPFIIGGTVGIVITLLGLAFVETIIPQTLESVVKAAAITLVVLLNVAIQTLQSGIRAIVVDVCPPEQQARATAWASRFIGIGNILGYFAGSIRLPESIVKHESLRFRCLSILSCLLLAFTVVITILSVQEPSTQTELYNVQDGKRYNIVSPWNKIVLGFQNMSERVWWVCKVQFFSWMAWFGFLFYSSSYIRDLYLVEHKRFGALSKAVDSHSVAVGSSANLLFAIIAFIASVTLPAVIGTSELFSTTALSRKHTEKSLKQLSMLWALSSLLYSLCTFSTIFVASTSAGVVLVAITGLSWAVTQWVPFALISTEISSHQYPQKVSSLLGAEEAAFEEIGGMESGVMLGLHNAAMSLPQILSALMSSTIFWIARRANTEEDAVGWVLRCSAGASLVAAWMVYRGMRWKPT